MTGWRVGRRADAPSRQPLPRGFAALWVAVVVDLVGFGMVLPILPLYARRFGATPLQAALLVAAFSGASLLAAPLWGRVSDRVGRKPVLVVALLGTAAGGLLTGLAGGLALLFVARLLDGASGGSISVARAAAADMAPPHERARLFGYLGAAFGIGFVAGPVIGGIATIAGPRVPFLLAGGIASINALAVAWRLPRPVRPTPTPHGQTAGGRSGLGAPVVAVIAAAFSSMVAFSAFEATFALFGHHRLGLALGSAAGVFAGIGLVLVVVQGGLVRPVIARIGERRALYAGLGLDAVGLAVLGSSHTWALAGPALVVLAAGEGLVQTTLSLLVANLANPARRGQALGFQQAAGSTARVIGPAMGGALLGASGSGLPFLAGSILSAIAVVAARLSLPRSRSTAQDVQITPLGTDTSA